MAQIVTEHKYIKYMYITFFYLESSKIRYIRYTTIYSVPYKSVVTVGVYPRHERPINRHQSIISSTVYPPQIIITLLAVETVVVEL